MQDFQKLYFFDPVEVAEEMRDQKLTFLEAAVGEDAGYAYDPGIAPLSCYEKQWEWDIGGIYTKIRDLLPPNDVLKFDAFLGPVFYFRTLRWARGKKLKPITENGVKGKTPIAPSSKLTLPREFPKSYYEHTYFPEKYDQLDDEEEEVEEDDSGDKDGDASSEEWNGVLELYSSSQIADLLSKLDLVDMHTVYDLVPKVKTPKEGWWMLESKKEAIGFWKAWIQALNEAHEKQQAILLTWEID